MRAGIVGLSFSTGPHHARYVPIAARQNDGLFSSLGESPDGAERPGVDRDAALALLEPLLEDPSIRKVGHDLKFDVIVLARHGVALAGLEFDSMLASYLLDATRAGHPLEESRWSTSATRR